MTSGKTHTVEQDQPAAFISLMPFTGPGLSQLTTPINHQGGWLLKFL